ncbi:hypothetical protein ACFOJ6_19805 [Gordonia humi]|uniref:hypothetical protein n=1 Tax=Gordonia humi TaxID=686429 RepID=UPI00360BFC87
MSTIDPRDRLRRRPWFLPALRGTMWTLSGVVVFVIAFVLAAYPFEDNAWALGLVAIPILLVVAVGITDANTEAPARKARYPWPFLLWMLGLWATSTGVGLLLGRAWSAMPVSDAESEVSGGTLIVLGVVFLLAGIALSAAAIVLRERRGRRARRARSVELTGPRVPAVVTEVGRHRGDDTVRLWNITLRFTDSHGTDRWHRAVHHRALPVGEQTLDPLRPR